MLHGIGNAEIVVFHCIGPACLLVSFYFIRKSGYVTQIFQTLLWAVPGSRYVRSAHGRYKKVWVSYATRIY